MGVWTDDRWVIKTLLKEIPVVTAKCPWLAFRAATFHILVSSDVGLRLYHFPLICVADQNDCMFAGVSSLFHSLAMSEIISKSMRYCSNCYLRRL
jgi:hypothetical protein